MLRRLRYWLNQSQRQASLREEIELHIAEKAEQLESEGLSKHQALAEARRQFGNLTQTQEDSREIWITRFLSDLAQDLRYATRSLSTNKAFSAMAILSLALGIGANTVIYSFMESILLRSLPVEKPESLVVLNWQSPSPMNANKEWVHVMHGLQGMGWPGDKGTMFSGMFPYPAFEALQKDNTVFSTLFGYFDGRNLTLNARGQAATAKTEYVTGAYFRGLGIAPAAGRLINTEDDKDGAAPAAVLSFNAAQNRFGSPANAIGQPILIDKHSFTVIGVTPPEFFGVDPAAAPELFLPMRATMLLDRATAAKGYSDPNFYWIEIMGRLQPGATIQLAQSILAPRFQQWVNATAFNDAERARLPQLQLNPGTAGLGSLRREYSKPLFVLLAMVVLILTITCANLANLLLARATARRREVAIRLSLGASRFRIVRQLLTESTLLAFLGGALGLLLAYWGVQALTHLFSRGRENFTLHAELNFTVLAMTAALSLCCGLLFGLVPALQITRPNLSPALKTRQRPQQFLIVAQIAMSFLILVTAGLFVQTLNQLGSLQLGYSRENILLFTPNSHQAGHQNPELTNFYTELRKRFEAIPGVNAASLAHASILNAARAGGTNRGPMKINNANLDNVGVIAAGPQYLSTMQIPLLAGREIDDRDQATSPPVAIVSERLARKYFDNKNPIGQRITLVQEKRNYEIIGVSANLRYGSLKTEGPMTIFLPLTQSNPEGATFALRTNGDPLSYANQIREIVRQSDPAIPVTNLMTQAAEIDRSLNRELTFAHLCTGFALLALLTACVGLYGTMSYSVNQQIGEIGLRMALGAQRGQVQWMILRQVLILLAIGLAISIPAILATTRLIKSLLYNTKPNDPTTMALAATTLLTAALLAAYPPAHRASRIDPQTALRHQ